MQARIVLLAMLFCTGIAQAAIEVGTGELGSDLYSNPSQKDANVKKRLERIYDQFPALDEVTVGVDAGVVTLTGKVLSKATSDKAAEVANRLPAVVAVNNSIEQTAEIRERVTPALAQAKSMGLRLLNWIPLLLAGLLLIVLFYWLARLVSRQDALFGRLTPNVFVARLSSQVAGLITFVLGLYAVLELFGATAILGTLLGAAGVVGLALGFALKDTVENFIASLMLSIRQPFSANDIVRIEGHEGVVSRLTTRATILITYDGNHVRIPNSTVFKAIIVNYSRHPERRFDFTVGVSTEIDLGNVQALALSMMAEMEGVLDTPKPQALIEALGDSNVVLHIYGWVDQGKFSFLKVKSETIRLIKVRFDDADIAMPEPTYNLKWLGRSALSVVESDEKAGLNNKVEDRLTHRKEVIEDSHSKPVAELTPDDDVEKQVKADQQDHDGNLLNASAKKEM